MRRAQTIGRRGAGPAAAPASRAAPDVPARALALLLGASGAAALVYQVVWVKQLSLVVGVDVFAVTAGVSAFFAGLALGSAVLGRLADRLARPLRLFAALEAGVAATGMVTTLALPAVAEPFARLEVAAGPLAWALPAALVGVPAALMGGTLPALLAALGPGAARVGGAGGALYAANTAGAVAGALLAPFALIPALGVRGTAAAAAALDLAAGAAALWLASRAPARAPPPDSPVARPIDPPRRAALALALYAAAGGLALGYEVVWTQAIVPLLSTRAFAFAVVLATYLVGLSLGAGLQARRVDRLRDPWGAFGLRVAGAGAAAALGVALLGRWVVVLQTAAEAGVLSLTGNALAGMSARFAAACAVVVLPPTLLLGAAFPIALRLTVGAGRAGQGSGLVVALNTAGGIAGTVLTGVVLVPRLGLVRALTALALCAAALGLAAALLGSTGGPRRRLAPALVAGLVLATATFTPADALARLLPAAQAGHLVFYEEGAGGTVAVVERAGPQPFRRLYIQGVSNSGDSLPSVRYMRLQASLPLLIHPGQPRAALVIGLGTGITAGALLPHAELERRVVAEILPAVARAATRFRGNLGAPDDPRVELRLRDGRRELLASPDRYDVITLEPPPPSAAGVVNLYSRDFYALAARRLERGGLLAQWLPLPTQNDEDTRALVRSFLDVFPQAALWTTELHEMLLVGSLEPIALDVPRIRARLREPRVAAALREPRVAAALREVGIASPAALLATWVTDRAGLERYAAGAPPVTDDRPGIEYAPWVRPGELLRTLPNLLALRTAPPLAGCDAACTAEVTAERDRLLLFYQAALDAYRGDRERWAEQLRRVLAADGDNPYYRWFVGGGDRT